jgi:predicted transcriptional regulator
MLVSLQLYGRPSDSRPGLLDLVATKYLILITQRDQVAQIRGKSVYTIKDVTLIPLSSQSDAEEAIVAATRALKQGKKTIAEVSEESDVEDDADTRRSREST